MPRTSGFDALGFGFSVTADDAQLVDDLSQLFGSLRRREAAHEYTVVPCRLRRETRGFEVHCDGARIARVERHTDVASVLVHDVTCRALAATDALVLHAGGVVWDGATIALPGDTAAGKSTLVAGLVRNGMAYVTDEALAIERATGAVDPYPKPLSIDRGAWSLFPELSPSRLRSQSSSTPSDEMQVAPSEIRPDCLACAASIALVLFPHYAFGADTGLEPISRGAALVELTKHTFGFRDRARENLDVLADVVRRAECFTFMMGDLQSAVGLVRGLVGAEDRGRM